MCPVCIATLVQGAMGVISVGAWIAFVIKKLRTPFTANYVPPIRAERRMDRE